ncbi:unnamed protein product, partial [Symbiodinium sp. KB8]
MFAPAFCIAFQYLRDTQTLAAYACIHNFTSASDAPTVPVVSYDSSMPFSLTWQGDAYLMQNALVQTSKFGARPLPPWLTCTYAATRFDCTVDGLSAPLGESTVTLCLQRRFALIPFRLTATAYSAGYEVLFSSEQCTTLHITVASPELNLVTLPANIGVLENNLAFAQVVISNESPHLSLRVDVAAYPATPDVGLLADGSSPEPTTSLRLAPKGRGQDDGKSVGAFDVAVRNTLSTGLKEVLLVLDTNDKNQRQVNITLPVKQEEAPVFIFASNPIRSQGLVQSYTQVVEARAGDIGYEFFSVVAPTAADLSIQVVDAKSGQLALLDENALHITPTLLEVEEFSPQTVFISADFTRSSLWEDLGTLEYTVMWTFVPNVTDGSSANVEQLNTSLTIRLLE